METSILPLKKLQGVSSCIETPSPIAESPPLKAIAVCEQCSTSIVAIISDVPGHR